ncbi:MAG: DUF4065 domain-containing protein [Planctomycetota bacterium]|nr:MAG: DUF4065 domain-containing protein [Planctomycetota bacterium]
MASVFDVAAYILAKRHRMTAMKLQKLVYYSLAWSLVWDEEELFREPIEAWTYGPVCPDLYQAHKGQFIVTEIPNGDPNALTEDQRETIDAVLDGYGKATALRLSQLTHQERPWKEARKGLSDEVFSTREIDLNLMTEYYSNLVSYGQKPEESKQKPQ